MMMSLLLLHRKCCHIVRALTRFSCIAFFFLLPYSRAVEVGGCQVGDLPVAGDLEAVLNTLPDTLMLFNNGDFLHVCTYVCARAHGHTPPKSLGCLVYWDENRFKQYNKRITHNLKCKMEKKKMLLKRGRNTKEGESGMVFPFSFFTVSAPINP